MILLLLMKRLDVSVFVRSYVLLPKDSGEKYVRDKTNTNFVTQKSTDVISLSKNFCESVKTLTPITGIQGYVNCETVSLNCIIKQKRRKQRCIIFKHCKNNNLFYISFISYSSIIIGDGAFHYDE